MTSLGFVVLARRPAPKRRCEQCQQSRHMSCTNPYQGSCCCDAPVGYTHEPVSAVFNGPKALEQAQNVLESCEQRRLRQEPIRIPGRGIVAHQFDVTGYVIGEIRACSPPESGYGEDNWDREVSI